MKYINRFLSWIFSWAALGIITGVLIFTAMMVYFSREIPDFSRLENYEPATVSRVYSGEGVVLDEFASEKRLYTPTDEMPDALKQAFVSAEDKNFYEHGGYDVRGMAAALRDTVLNDDPRGASTIPQQVAKIFLLSGDRNIERKVREVVLSNRLVNEMDRDHILGLYLNEIYLGQNSYGVTAAARTYFSKTLEELNLQEIAYLAALPKAPAELHPVRDYDRSVERRNYVLKEMYENGYITEEEEQEAQAAPLLTVQNGDIESYANSLPRRDYFTDEIRRQLSNELGEDVLFDEGLSVRATIDRNLQNRASAALRQALESYDRSKGYFNGVEFQVDLGELDESGWEEALNNTVAPRDIEGWFPAVILEAGDNAKIGVEGFGEGELPLSSLTWMTYTNSDGAAAKVRAASNIFERGDVIFVKDLDGRWSYRQVPTVSGAFAAIDPRNGRVLAVVGGFSYEYSNFNRATQALRQPGSSFKPFVYAAALDSGVLPNATIVDAPIVINTPQGIWRPQNASHRYYGPTPMMTGLEQSRNLMTIRLAQDVGMDKVASYGERYGVYDDMQAVLANSLGSQETTLYRMISAYSTFANGGKAISPTVVDRVQDRYGKSIYSHDERDCIPCNSPDADPSEPPRVLSRQEQVMDPITAYQIMTMLKSVVANGTAKKTVGRLGLPIAGKTGTTNEAKDVWFIGFTPKIVAGCYIGYDDPRPLGRSATGGSMCGPVFSRFIVEALKTYGGFEYEVPDGGYFVYLDRFSGQRLADGASGSNVIRMLFRESTAPAIGSGGKVIDGGFAMGEDVPLFSEERKSKNSEVKVQVNGQTKVAPKAPSAAAISSGGLY